MVRISVITVNPKQQQGSPIKQGQNQMSPIRSTSINNAAIIPSTPHIPPPNTMKLVNLWWHKLLMFVMSQYFISNRQNHVNSVKNAIPSHKQKKFYLPKPARSVSIIPNTEGQPSKSSILKLSIPNNKATTTSPRNNHVKFKHLSDAGLKDWDSTTTSGSSDRTMDKWAPNNGALKHARNTGQCSPFKRSYSMDSLSSFSYPSVDSVGKSLIANYFENNVLTELTRRFATVLDLEDILGDLEKNRKEEDTLNTGRLPTIRESLRGIGIYATPRGGASYNSQTPPDNSNSNTPDDLELLQTFRQRAKEFLAIRQNITGAVVNPFYDIQTTHDEEKEEKSFKFQNTEDFARWRKDMSEKVKRRSSGDGGSGVAGALPSVPKRKRKMSNQ